jgi:hypothetical protein
LGLLLLASSSTFSLVTTRQSGTDDVKRHSHEQTVIVAPQVLLASRSKQTVATVTVNNVTSVEKRVVGFEAACHCVHVSGLPIVVRPFSQQSVKVTVEALGPPEQTLELHIADTEMRETIACRIMRE